MKPNNKSGIRTGMDADSFREDIKQHLRYTLAKDDYASTQWDIYQAVVLSVMDRLHERWSQTQQRYYQNRVKRVYYLSMEYLIGRLMDNMLINLGLQEAAADAFSDLDLDYQTLRETEVDAGLGNGGLGRLAACYLDSMATLGVPAIGYGIRYDYGIFEQALDDGYQVEKPDLWLRYGYPWSIMQPEVQYPVKFYGETVARNDGNGNINFDWINTREVLAQAYDTPIPGYGNEVVNHLRLWNTATSHTFNLKSFNQGDYIDAVRQSLDDENISRVLYPNDKEFSGRELRLKQEYFLVSATLQDAFRRFKKQFDDFTKIPQQMAIQCNDTHPHLAIPEMMRLLMDREGLPWEKSWQIVTQTVNYTNHTLMPEALEKWPLSLMSNLLPRHVQIIREIDRRFLNSISIESHEESERKNRMRIVSDEMNAAVRMGNLGAIGAHKINGVSKIHTKLMEETTFSDFYREFPDKFTNVTNGITPRRWLLQCNPALAKLIISKIGKGWITDLGQLKKIEKFASDFDFVTFFGEVKQQKKQQLADYIQQELNISLNPNSLFDIQVKRIHEYKRQLLAAFHAVTLYNRIKANPPVGGDHTTRAILFAGKAAPGYAMAKLHIKLINNIAEVINGDEEVNDILQCVFLPNYSVSLAEKMIPAADLSEQISTAGTEASGTGNMKLALNGALTIGTRDGANIEIRERVRKDNMFLFGLTINEIDALRREGYNPNKYLDADSELEQVIEQLSSGFFSQGEPDLFQPIIKALLNEGDYYAVLADYRSYIEKHGEVEQTWQNKREWNRRAIINIANMGYFSSDRSVKEYAQKIWKIEY